MPSLERVRRTVVVLARFSEGVRQEGDLAGICGEKGTTNKRIDSNRQKPIWLIEIRIVACPHGRDFAPKEDSLATELTTRKVIPHKDQHCVWRAVL